MKRLHLLHLGIGNVGAALVMQIQENRNRIKREKGIDLTYCGIFSSKGGIFQKNGLNETELKEKKFLPQVDVQKVIEKMPLPFVLIDTTASEETIPFIEKVLKQGGFVVLSNKKPLTGYQKQFERLNRYNEKLFYETTVGAGLPVIQTIKTLQATGDDVIIIQGCFSGTLGFICSAIEDGMDYSQAVAEAKEKGFTEPDPRDDLSGLDVARKALILARLMGQKKKLKDIPVEKLYPENMSSLPVDAFMKRIKTLDIFYREKMKNAKRAGNTVRFVAEINKLKIRVGLTEVPKGSSLGNLKGPDNIISIQTMRYFKNPLIIQGPGAGKEVTAAGVFGDILTIAGVL